MKKYLVLVSLAFTVGACNIDFPEAGAGGAGGHAGAGGTQPAMCDADGDGHTVANVNACIGVGNNADCNDQHALIHPGAQEICDLRDNDCDGSVDEGNVCGGNPPPTDSDGDGDPDATDCAPMNPNAYHGKPEVCGDGYDNDCDGSVDEGCGTGSGGGQQVQMVQIYLLYRAGLDIDHLVWGKGYLMGAGDLMDGYKECMMNLWGIEGASEVYICTFTFPVGSQFEFWAETTQNSDAKSLFILDVCDYPGAPQCGGKGNFCSVMYGAPNADMWITRDGPEGPVLWNAGGVADRMAGAPRYVDNGDPHGLCSANGKVTIQ